MDATEAYSFLLFDSFLAELIFPLQTQLVFPAMIIFGGYNLFLVWAVTLVGTIAGGLGNWYIGRLIDTARNWYGLADPNPEGKIGRIQRFCQKWEKWLAGLCALVPIVGSIGAIALGFFGVSVRPFIIVFSIVKALFLAAFLF
jgi:membrane protein YqaA with SNARE-associated domain